MAKVWSAIFTLMGLFTLATASTAPAIFIFGDSLVDTGNNNYITTLSKGDIWFNGIDFGNGLPTGRFCNGRTTPDYICQIMGVPSPVPYLDPEANGRNILAGVNFASGGSGILPSTGYKYIGRIPFERQIEYFSNTKADLISVVEQAENASHLISEALFYINIGSYDYISNYFLSQSRVSQLYSVNRYQQLLLVKFAEHLKDLYEMGARKILVSNLVPLGCTPLLISSRNPDNGSCVHYINSIITEFNKGLENMLKNELQMQFSDARFILSDNYAILSQVINDPSAFGFKYANESCCGIGRLRAEFPCTPISSLCFHRADYVFWDAFHTSDALNSILANLQYAGSPEFVRPINLKDLMALS
ncbi:hypothetical protein SUGI_0578530 [Cryptomeria japonica]|uniref:GDSL esterase/lipase At1g71691-like n=1 Tax=Cryptomeria japonica TaxID=3369 RepID=UPI002414BF4C|nr:GDSL esterase/lipase At1g71691-like [Cryptomeria japonica]GLJ29337.1 hypothetical protein SUGI_0578530 [Cryptomeria japonica]